jgi:type IV pilus assembly protein PilA
MYAPPAAPVSSPKRWPTWLIVVLAGLGACAIVLPILAVLAVYGVRKYLANAKMAEARNALGQIASDAAKAYERDHVLCASAVRPVPASMTMLRGTKYQSAAADWQADATRHAGFSCLGFSLDSPQYFQYSYVVSRANPGEFVATAHGDLNGDRKESTFIVRGEVKAGTLLISPTIEETDPEE